MEGARHEYLALVKENLIDKQWFKKVDALERFGDYEDFGRGPKWAPRHNLYIPAPTIVKMPKFEDYTKEDDLGEAFTYRTADSHTPSPLIPQATAKPVPFEPRLPAHENPWLSDQRERRPLMRKWSRDRRLSKSKREQWKSAQLPTRWHSTGTPSNISPEEEEKLIREYEQTYARKQIQINIRQCVMQPLASLPNLFGAAWPFFGQK